MKTPHLPYQPWIVLGATCMLAGGASPLFAAVPAARRAVVPQASLVPIPEVPITADQWKISGDGKRAEDTGILVQDGRNALSASFSAGTAPNFRFSGEVLLPINASLNISLPSGQEQPVGEAPKAYTTKLTRGKYALRWDRMDIVQPNADPLTTWVPFSVDLLNGVFRISMAGRDQMGALAANGAAIWITAGAQMRNLSAFTLPALPALLKPASISSQANLKLAGEGGGLGDGLALDAAAQPKGFVQTDGIPFSVPSGNGPTALDVKTSMSGWDDNTFRSVKSYFNPNIGIVAGKTSREVLSRGILNVPATDYSAIHLLAFSRDDAKLVPRMTVRIGYFGASSGILADRTVNVPTWNGDGAGNEYVVSRIPMKLANGKSGFLYHLRVPMENTANLSTLAPVWPVAAGYNVEFTRDIQTRIPVPDPFEFGTLPAGTPSGVVVLGATMECTPVKLSYTTQEPGNIFNQPQRVVYQTKLTNNDDKPLSGRVYIKATGPGTQEDGAVEKKQLNAESTFTLQPGESKEFPLDITPDQRGWYQATVGLEAGGKLLQERDTTFAVLAPDTRTAGEESPFGVWCFWYAHALSKDPDRPDQLASIMRKGGWRWTYGGDPTPGLKTEAEITQRIQYLKDKYKFGFTLPSAPQSHQGKEGWYDEAVFARDIAPWLAASDRKGYEPSFKVLHESRSSTALIRRFGETLGGAPYDMPADEKASLEKQFAGTVLYTKAIKQADPKSKIVLFNDYPAVVNEYLKRGFPADNFDVIGTEDSNFMREPERQPDWLSLLGTVTQLKRIQKQYGYNKPIWTTEALYHPTGPGGLSLHAQGTIAVREAMLALANGVQRMCAAGLVADSSDDYYWSNWGSAGFCFRDPELNPKPSYAMYSWMTQILDRAQFANHLDTGSTVLHALDFQKPDGSHIYPIWLVRGQQTVTLTTGGAAPVVYDVYGNRLNVTPRNGQLTLKVSDAPLYVTGTTVTAVTDHQPVEEKADAGKVILDFQDPAQLKPVAEPSPVLQTVWSTPLRPGDFATSQVQEDGATALRVELREDKDPDKLVPRYVQLALTNPITLADRPFALALRVKGNGGWGRIMYELQDAAGRTWTSCGNTISGASNSFDSKGESFISFDGWRTIEMRLPGQYAAVDQFVHWPDNYNWWPTGAPVDAAVAEAVQKAQAAGTKVMPAATGHDPVTYPIKLTKIIVAMRPNVLYVNDEVPLKNRAIFLDRLGVLAPPPGY